MIRDLWAVLHRKLTLDRVYELEYEVRMLRSMVQHFADKGDKLMQETHALNIGISILIGKLMPDFVLDHNDPNRRRESELLGEEVIKKMLAEDKARRHMEGRP